MHTTKPLKLKANDAKDIDIISTFLQDAIVPVQGLRFHKEGAQFLMFANRFRWELTTETKHHQERTHTGISFSHITNAIYKGFDLQTHHNDAMNLLTIRLQKSGKKIQLIFSDNGEIILTAKKVAIHLQDMSEPWPAMGGIPNHQVAEA